MSAYAGFGWSRGLFLLVSIFCLSKFDAYAYAAILQILNICAYDLNSFRCTTR